MSARAATAHASPASPQPVERFLGALVTDPALDGRVAAIHEEPARDAAFAPLPPELNPALAHALRADGRGQLYVHQREAIDHALAGRHVAIATETSSGKSLCFQVPVLQAVLGDPAAHALFVFPTNPLANDQLASLEALLRRLPPERRPRGPVRLQGAMGAQKDRLAADDPQLVLTNPEMVHLHLLPQHRRWARFWAGLRYIVVDEIHLYRGAFGGHLANLLRRVRRCAWRYGARPQVIAASATVGNPRELAEELCAAPFELVSTSSAARGTRRTVLWRPPVDERGKVRSHVDESVELFRRSLQAGLQSILFARSRQLVEAMVSRLEEQTGRSRIQLGVRAYRGGYTRDEREVIEQGLRAGTVRGVVTTNALEVGIDIGSLDVCVIAGYPGSVMAMRQQAGRVGRRDRSSAIFVVASQSPLDGYVVAHPEVLTQAEPERAVVGRTNRFVLKDHLACAAAEFPLWRAEIDRLGQDDARRLADELVSEGAARWIQDGARESLWCPGRPHGQVSLRSASQERWQLVDPDGEPVGELDGAAVAREAHPGAVYLHQGRAFRVDRLEDGRVFLQRAPAGVQTRVQGERQVAVHEVVRREPLAHGAEALLAVVDVIDRYSSYVETGARGRSSVRQIEPPLSSELRTEALVVRLPPESRRPLQEAGLAAPEAGLHGAEHLLTGLVSSFVLCDRDDVEGHSVAGEDGAAIVVFDRYPGGMGFSRGAFDRVRDVLARAGDAVDACDCVDGCPACVHTGRCLRSGDEVSKQGARLVLRWVRGLELEPAAAPAAGVVRRRPARARPAPVAEAVERKPRGTARTNDQPWQPEFGAGDRVEHAVFGEGRVIEVRPSGRVVVDFGDGKARRITPGWLRPAR